MKPYIREMLLKWLAEQWEDWTRIPEEDRPLFTVYCGEQGIELVNEVVNEFKETMSMFKD